MAAFASSSTPPSTKQVRNNFGLAFTEIQLGRKDTPAQIVTFGFPSDNFKRSTSCHLVLKDPQSIAQLAAIEGSLELKASAEGYVLNSNVLRTTSLDGIDYPVIRLKVTKDAEHFTTVDPWATGAAVNLTDLDFGHLVLAVANPVIWARNKECGITLYANVVRCLGRDERAVGRRERAPVEWA